jgi:ApaG protein
MISRATLTPQLPLLELPKDEKPMSFVAMYEAVTRGVRVRVTPQFVEAQSSPDDGRFFWAYTVEVRNESDEAIQLKSRYWRITDADGNTSEVRGPGVVGQTSTLLPGDSFEYTSGCPLSTPSGIMVGSYQMITEGGEPFNAGIPAFSLDSPYGRRVEN